MLKIKLLGGALAAFLTVPAFAQSATGYGMDEFRSLDVDRNGVITQAEWNRAHRRSLAAQGATMAERRESEAHRRESTFRILDSNADGAITPAEAGLNTELMQAFARVDLNRDGRIERAEFDKVHVRPAEGPAAAGASAGTR